MSFSDLTFLFYFLPLFFAVYYILPFRFKNAALVLGSFAFYFIGAGARDTLLLSGVLLLHYALARAMAGKEVRTRKALLIIALRRTSSASCISSTLHLFWKIWAN